MVRKDEISLQGNFHLNNLQKKRYIDQQVDVWIAKAHCQRVERLK